MTGFLHISKIATGWIRNFERYVWPKQKAVLEASRVDKGRAEFDTLSSRFQEKNASPNSQR